MFPQETHQKIVAELDKIELNAHRLYLKTARLRLRLMREWHVLPGGERWTQAAQDEAEGKQ